MTKQKTQKQINTTEKLISALSTLIGGVFADIWKQLKVLGDIFWTNMKGPWKSTWKKKLATMIVISLTLYPLTIHYLSTLKDVWIYTSNIIHREEIITNIQTSHEKEVRSFFEEYNRKYSIDCDWIRRINVDQNMFLKYGTIKKPGSSCVTTEKWQLIPLVIGAPQIDETNQIVKVRGKVVLVVSEGDKVKAIEKNDFELWKQWNSDLWKVNSLANNKQKYKPI